MGNSARRALLKLAPTALVARVLQAAPQVPQPIPPLNSGNDAVRLPNGKLQSDEILKADYASNLKDARELMDLTKAFELDLEKSDANVLSLSLLKKLDDIDKLTKRIRGRMKR
jgi:hypothetical protein